MVRQFHGRNMGALLGLLMVLVATSAWADSGFYVGVKGGIDFWSGTETELIEVIDESDPTNTKTTKGTLDSDMGPAVMGSVGYALGNGVRLEGEISWRRNAFDKFSGDDGSSRDIEGDLQNLAFMLNGAYDFHFDSPITPFVMGGLGVAIVESEITKVGESPTSHSDANDTVFAYQVGAGLSYQVTPKVAFDVSYRFFGTQDLVFDGGGEMTNTHHNVLVGLSYSF